MNLNFIRRFTQKTGIYYRLANIYLNLIVKPKYKKLEKRNRIKLENINAKAKIILDPKEPSQIVNRLPNSGGIPIEVDKIDVMGLQSDIIRKESRKTGIQDFEGMALNDAVAVESWQYYSFLELAKTISAIAKSHSGKNT